MARPWAMSPGTGLQPDERGGEPEEPSAGCTPVSAFDIACIRGTNMNAGVVRMSIALGALLNASPCLAVWTPWPDAAASFDPTGVPSDPAGPAVDALGLPDYTFASIDFPRPPVLTFPRDITGWDAAICDLSNCPVIGRVGADRNDVTCIHLGTADRPIGFDLTGYPTLAYVRYMKSMGLDPYREFPDRDLNKTEILRPVASISGVILLTAIATGLIGWLHRYRTQ